MSIVAEEAVSQLLEGEDSPMLTQPAPRPWRRPVTGGVLGVAALLAMTAIASRSQTSRNPRASHFAHPAAVELSIIAGPKAQKRCAKNDSEDCSESQCCEDIGYQCYAKSDGWAVCKEACDPAEMKKYDPDHEEWTCEELGERARCANDGEDCRKLGCCETPGAVCYEKNDMWSVCMEGCNATAMKQTDPKHEQWSCKEIGERNSKPAGPEAQKKCAKKDSEDCSESQCCEDIGYQCYSKGEAWAVCKEACDPAEMKKYDPDHEEWTCEELGERARCAKDGEDCHKLGCCETPGAVCYEKNEMWSVCMESCNATAMKQNDPKHEQWTCKEIGERNYKSKCSWAGQECSKSKCCNNNGFTCVQKDETFAGCTLTTKKSTWFAKKVPIPDGWEGTVLGGDRSEYEVQPVPEGQPIHGASLFCFMVYLPNSTEESLMWLAMKNGVSIFGCNESMTLHSWKSAGAGWDTGETTLVNTDVFVNAFENIRKDGRYLKWDWTVKADPDCVFFADRLMGHLWAIRAPPYMPLYIKNNGVDPGLGNNGFLGAIEIFSKTAMKTFFANAAECNHYLGVDSGEDGFFKGCMDALGVGFMTDTHIFTPDYDPAVCREGKRVAFHPIKTYKEYQCCVDIVMGISRNPVFGKCEDDDSSIERPWYHEKA